MSDTDIKALIERLRNGRFVTWMDALAWCYEAVAALEALQAANERLHEELIKAGELIDSDLLARAVKAEANYSEAVAELTIANDRADRAVEFKG